MALLNQPVVLLNHPSGHDKMAPRSEAMAPRTPEADEGGAGDAREIATFLRYNRPPPATPPR